MGVDQAIDRKHEQNHDAGPNAGNEQLRNGGLGDNPVDDETDAGRNQKGDVAGVDDQCQRERIRIARFKQLWPKWRANSHYRCLGRAGHCPEQGTRRRGTDGQAAFNVAYECHDHVDQPVSGLTSGHNVRRQNEHWNRNQGGWPDAAHHLLDEGAHLAEAVKHHYKADHCACDQRNHHREAQQQQPDHDQHHYSCHDFLSFLNVSCRVHTSDSVSE